MRRELWVIQVDLPDDFDTGEIVERINAAIPEADAVHGYAVHLPIPDIPPKQSDYEEVN